MKKILILGDYKEAEWHSLGGADAEFKRILAGFELTITEDYPDMKLADLQRYDLIINYIGGWGKRAGSDFAGALLGYVAAGGPLLTLHGGIIAHTLPEIEQLVGAAFTGHPEREVLEYVHVGEHPITEGVKPFSMDEEPYQLEMDNLAKVQMILEYVYRGEKYPAAWVRNYGSGRTCYLSMGHDPACFTNEGFGLLIRRGAQWCLGEL